MRNSSFRQYSQCHWPGMRAFAVMPFLEEYCRTARLASDPVGIHPAYPEPSRSNPPIHRPSSGPERLPDVSFAMTCGGYSFFPKLIHINVHIQAIACAPVQPAIVTSSECTARVSPPRPAETLGEWVDGPAGSRALESQSGRHSHHEEASCFVSPKEKSLLMHSSAESLVECLRQSPRLSSRSALCCSYHILWYRWDTFACD